MAHLFSSLCEAAAGWIRTLDLTICSRAVCHCATVASQS
jgi:hypothetical protein